MSIEDLIAKRRKEWGDSLREKYPNVRFPRYGIECDSGWSILIDPIIHLISQHNEAFPDHPISVDCLKEKFGGLRMYISIAVPENPEAAEVHPFAISSDRSYDRIMGAVNLAEKISYDICEKCGQRGEIVKGSWLKVRCPSCKQGEQQPQPQPQPQWTWGDRLTPQEAKECAEAAGDPRCQACGVKWEDHHQLCEGSNLSDEQKLLMETEHRLRMKRAGVTPKEGAD